MEGFLGKLSLTELQEFRNIRRPGIATSDPAYYRYTLIVAALMFLLVLWQIASKPGRAWAAIRESEPAALAAGVNITQYKLWAFALASFVTGVAGGLLAGSAGALSPVAFPTQDSIVLLAVVLMGGIYSLWGAVVAGLLVRLLPALLENWGVSIYVSILLFGIGVLQVLATAPGGLVDQVPKDVKRLGRGRARLLGDRREGTGGMIEVEGLTVRFGGVTPIDDMTVTFPGGACGLIGPNGAGKTTFFNVLSGFVKPAAGSIRAFGDDLLKMADFRRARWGLRRSFQTGAGDQGPVGVRQRRHGARALGAGARLSQAGRARRARLRRTRGLAEGEGRRAGSARPAPARGCASDGRKASRRAPRRAGGRPPRRGDGPHG